MNEANVAALKAILVEVLEPGNLSADEIGDLAEDLAASGVLVPSSLGPGDAALIVAAGMKEDPPLQWTPNDAGLVSQLHRIAKGET
jgi:hypothetical protein